MHFKAPDVFFLSRTVAQVNKCISVCVFGVILLSFFLCIYPNVSTFVSREFSIGQSLKFKIKNKSERKVCINPFLRTRL